MKNQMTNVMSRILINKIILTLLNLLVFGIILSGNILFASGGKIVGKVIDADTKLQCPA